MLSPTVFHIALNTPVEPVKWIPASSGLARTGSPIALPRPYTRLITPGGRPAASKIRITKYAEYEAVEAGFQITVLPISAGDADRLPPIAVKLNGVTANTKPSSGRYSMRFHTPCDERGCSS